MRERLHKVLAHAGVASRRAAERLIREHRVRVNGATVLELGTQVERGTLCPRTWGHGGTVAPGQGDCPWTDRPIGHGTIGESDAGRPQRVRGGCVP